MTNQSPKPLPLIGRLSLALTGLLFIILALHIMSRLSSPSLYVNALKLVNIGPQQIHGLQTPAYLNYKNLLYLNGTITSASQDNATTAIFTRTDRPYIQPSLFNDTTGAVEIILPEPPLSSKPLDYYHYGTPYHLLGYRSGETDLVLLAIAPTHAGLKALLQTKAKGWKNNLLFYGFILGLLVFVIFWLLNMSLLSTPWLEPVQVLIGNVVFLVLYYSILFLAGYPLIKTLWLTFVLLGGINLLVVPMAFLLRSKNAKAPGQKENL